MTACTTRGYICVMYICMYFGLMGKLGKDWHTQQTSIQAREVQQHRGDASLCLNRDCRMEVGGGEWGAAGRSGGSGIPDTELQSVWITSHRSFRAITTLTGEEAEGGGRDRASRDGH